MAERLRTARCASLKVKQVNNHGRDQVTGVASLMYPLSSNVVNIVSTLGNMATRSDYNRPTLDYIERDHM